MAELDQARQVVPLGPRLHDLALLHLADSDVIRLHRPSGRRVRPHRSLLSPSEPTGPELMVTSRLDVPVWHPVQGFQGRRLPPAGMKPANGFDRRLGLGLRYAADLIPGSQGTEIFQYEQVGVGCMVHAPIEAPR
jgi:hypothetical protein